ncbi:MAG: hypothetical protein NZL88_09455 [Gaiellaceae bacterium]|nr:hypothetical protein [Gaiellaceae bacterium]
MGTRFERHELTGADRSGHGARRRARGRRGVGARVPHRAKELRAPVDRALERRAAEIATRPLGVVTTPSGAQYLAVRPEFGEARGYVQLVREDGTVVIPPRQESRLPVGDDVLLSEERAEAAKARVAEGIAALVRGERPWRDPRGSWRSGRHGPWHAPPFRP